MIKFTMGSCDNKKTHRRKPKRTIKNFSFPVSLGHQISVAGGNNAVSNVFSQSHGLLANSSISSSGSSSLRNGLALTTTASVVPPLPETLQAKFIQPNQEMHAAQEVIDVPDVMVESLSQNVCLLCHGQHKGDLNRTPDQIDKAVKDSTGFSLTLSQLQHWICADCQQTVTHEQEKRASHGLFDKCNVAVTSSQEFDTSCSCYSCKERRRIEEEQVQETLELHQSWTELQQFLQLIYEQAISQKVEHNSLGDQTSAQSGVSIDVSRARELVERLCAFDPHDLFQRVISSGQDYMIDCKARLASTCPSPGIDGVMSTLSDNEKSSNSSIECVGRFVAALLDEYDSLNRVCQNLSDVMDHLVKVHLCRFKLTIQMTFKQLFYSFIYADLQPHLSDIARQLRELTSLKDLSDPESSSDTFFLHRYLKFDDEMTTVSTEWRESYQLIEQYSDEQIALTTKNKFYEDVYSPPQQQAVEQYLLKNSKHGCCQCDECNVMRMVASGIISPDVTGGIDGHQSGDGSVLGYLQHRSANSDVPAVSFIDRSQFGLKGSGDGVAAHLFVPYLPAFEFPSGGEIPEEFDDDCSYQEQCSERCSPSDQSGSPEWKEQRLVEGQDTYSCVYGETNVMTSSSVDSGTRCDGSDDVDNDDADDEQDDSDDSCDDSKFVTWMQPSGSAQNHSLQTSQRSSVVQAQQCQCHSCCQQQQPVALNGLGMIRQPVTTPLYVHPQALNILASQQQQLQQNGVGVQSCPATLPAATVLGVLQPTLTGFDSSQSLLLPQLYQLQCPAPITVQPQHCMRTDRAGSMSGISTPVATLGTDIGTLGWQDVYGTGETFARGVQNANAWAPVGRPSPVGLQHNAVSVTTIPLAQTTSLWRMPSPNVGHCPTATAVFSAPSPSLVRAAHCTAAGNSNQPVIYSFQPPQQALVNAPLEAARPSVLGVPFFGVPLSTVGDLTSATSMGSRSVSGAGCNGTLNSISKMSSLATVGKCLASPVMSSTADVVSASQSTTVMPHNRPHSCQVHLAVDNQEKPNGSSVGSLPPSHCVGMSNGTGSCHHHHHHHEHVDDENDCDDDCDDCDDDEDDDCTSDESSAASGPKDGKYCECWHCEFFGHSAPPTVPTSKNYPEMRDRLRLRLKKKNEQKCGHQVDQSDELDTVQPEEKIEVPPACVTTELPPVDHSTMAIDDLVKFINGPEALDKDVKTSRKAAKRARQKMRKAAGKAPVALADERKCSQSKDKLDDDKTSEKTVVVDDIRPEMSSSVKQLQQISTSLSSEGPKLSATCQDKTVVSNGNLDSSCGEQNRKLTAEVKRVNSPKNSSSDDSKAVSTSVNHSTKDPLVNAVSNNKIVKGTRPSRSSTAKSSKLVGDAQTPEADKVHKRPNTSTVPMSSTNSQGTIAKPSGNDALPGNRSAKCKTASSGGGDGSQCVINEVTSVKSTSASNGSKQPSSSTAKSVYYAKPSALLPSTAECQPKVVYSAVDAREITAVQSKTSVAMANGDAVSNGRMAAGSSKKTAEVKQSDSKNENVVAGRTAGATKGTSSNSISGTVSPKLKTSVANGFGVHNKVATSSHNGSVEAIKVVRDIPDNTVTHAKPGGSSADVVGTNTATVVSHSYRNGLCKPLPPNMPVPIIKPDSCASSGLLTSSVASSSHSDNHSGRIDPNSRQQLLPSVPVVSQPSETPLQQDSIKGGLRTSPGVREPSGNKSRRNRRKAKSKDGMTAVDEIFLPKDHVEPGRLDEFEREIEEFKRFCFNSTPADNREKLQINMNLKDIFVKKK